MAVDFQVVFPQEVVDLSRVRYTTTGSLLPRALDIVGKDFTAVDEVLINDMESPDVLVLSATRLIAQLPDALQAKGTVNTVVVLSRRLTLNQRSLLKFRISDQPGRVGGILRTMQLFLKVLFTDPGSDIWDPKIGGGGLRKVGTTFGHDEGGSLLSDFVISVDTTTRQIIAIQARDSSLPPAERLMSAQVTSANFDRSQGAVLVSIDLISQAGAKATANLEL